MSTTDLSLAGDIGATYARFCLVSADGTLIAMKSFARQDFAGIAEAASAYLREISGGRPTRCVLAVAGSPTGDKVSLTNSPWTFSIEEVRKRIGLHSLRVVNDFYAHAAAIPHLKNEDRIQIGGGSAVANAPIGLIGPGTGLGVSALVPADRGPIFLGGEGGHVTMAPADVRESSVLDRLRLRHDHVSAERVISGPGLVNLYTALCELSGVPASALTPAQITDPHMRATDACAQEATAMFCAMLGTVAGNLALTVGARGGIYIAGGVVPKLGDDFARSSFRERFEAKGRFRSYLASIPTYVVVHPWAGLLGASKLLEHS